MQTRGRFRCVLGRYMHEYVCVGTEITSTGSSTIESGFTQPATGYNQTFLFWVELDDQDGMELPSWDGNREIETKFHILHTQSQELGTGVQTFPDWSLLRFAPQTQNARRDARYMQDKHHPGRPPGGRREVSFLKLDPTYVPSRRHFMHADTARENSIPSVPTPARVILQHVGAACAAWLPCHVPYVAAASSYARGTPLQHQRQIKPSEGGTTERADPILW